jgi:CHAD domain-containing protein
VSSQAPDEASTAVSQSPHQLSRVTLRAERKRRRSVPRLNAAMACDTAFRMIARGCLDDLTANHEATCRGDQAALHDMRIALTRLRAALSFFSPMAVDAESNELKQELKWLNGHLGAARDIDVAIERLKAAGKRQPQPKSNDRFWNKKSTDSHRALTRTLRSVRYRRLIKSASARVESGPWSTVKDKHAERQRRRPIARYSTRKLSQWHQKLLKKARSLEAMGAKKRHRIRLANKRLRYSIEFFAGLLAGKDSSTQATLKQLRKAQESLGELNDAFNGETLAANLQRHGLSLGESPQFPDRKREKHLLRNAIRAYRKMDALSPLYH